jgi:uncharacterized protein YegL
MTEIEFTNEQHAPTVDTDLTEIVCIVDRSGSMNSIKNDAIGGFNAFLNAHKDSQHRAIMTVIQFDDKYEIKYNGISPKDILEYDNSTFLPRGSTALYDAIGKTITDIDQRRSRDNTSPGKTIISILTDGEENSSREYRLEQIHQIIENKRNLGWEFIFVSAGLDKFTSERIGASFGLPSNRIMSVGSAPGDLTNAYNSIRSATLSYCATGSIDNYWNKSNDDNTKSTSRKNKQNLRRKEYKGYTTRNK